MVGMGVQSAAVTGQVARYHTPIEAKGRVYLATTTQIAAFRVGTGNATFAGAFCLTYLVVPYVVRDRHLLLSVLCSWGARPAQLGERSAVQLLDKPVAAGSGSCQQHVAGTHNLPLSPSPDMMQQRETLYFDKLGAACSAASAFAGGCRQHQQ